MRKGTIAVLGAGVAVAIAGASRAQAPAGPALDTTILPLASVALSAVALIVAFLAVRRAMRAEADFTRVTRSVEMALRDLSSRSERDAATIGELNRKIAEEIRALTEMPVAEPAPPPQAAAPVAMPVAVAEEAAPQRNVERISEAELSAADAVQAALVAAVASGESEVSLQPIVSVAQSAATGFEVHMHLEPGEGLKPVDIRRLAQPVPGLDGGAFEVALVRAAINAGRRQLGTATERMPFHVAVSEALLTNGVEVRAIAELAQSHKGLASSVVFSVPAALIAAGGEVRDRIDQLTAAGFRFALENWDGNAADAAMARKRGVHQVKIGANRLLDRERSRRRTAPGAELAAAATEAGLSVVATGVARDEDAVGLIDLGIDLMVGERFSAPRRIRSSAARQAALTGT